MSTIAANITYADPYGNDKDVTRTVHFSDHFGPQNNKERRERIEKEIKDMLDYLFKEKDERTD